MSKAMDAILTIEGVSYSYGHFQALDDVSLSLDRGEVRALIGPNGAGKSTLLKVICGELPVSRGRITFASRPVTNMKPYRLRHLGISRSFQDSQIMPAMTVMQHVKLAVQSFTTQRYSLWRRFEPNDELDERALEILRRLDMLSLKERLAGELSYADQRKMELALVLAGSPRLLLLDEPTAGMAMEESQRFAVLIQELCREQGISLLIVEHDMNVVLRISDKITVLNHGRVLFEGSPQEVQDNPEVQSVYIGGK